MHVYGPNEVSNLIKIAADENSDSPIQLPILSVSRKGVYELLNPNKQVLTYDGLMLEANERKSVTLNAIPIRLVYQLDVWTRYAKEADAYMRNLIFNILNYPTVTVTIPYNDITLEHNSSIRIITDVQDTSNENRLSIGQFTRFSIGINVDDAYLWDTRVRDNILIVEEIDL